MIISNKFRSSVLLLVGRSVGRSVGLLPEGIARNLRNLMAILYASNHTHTKGFTGYSLTPLWSENLKDEFKQERLENRRILEKKLFNVGNVV